MIKKIIECFKNGFKNCLGKDKNEDDDSSQSDVAGDGPPKSDVVGDGPPPSSESVPTEKDESGEKDNN